MSEKAKVKTYELFQQMIDDGENPNLNEVWNAAIEAAELSLHEKLKYPTEACAIVRGLKK